MKLRAARGRRPYRRRYLIRRSTAHVPAVTSAGRWPGSDTAVNTCASCTIGRSYQPAARTAAPAVTGSPIPCPHRTPGSPTGTGLNSCGPQIVVLPSEAVQ